MGSEIRQLLIRAPNWVGDVVLSLGAVRDLRRNFPETQIDVLARPWVAELYRAVAEVDGVREAGTFRGDVETLRGGYDAAVLLTNSFRTAFQAYLARVPERWGYATDARSALLTRRARVPSEIRGRSEVYYYRAMLAGVGLTVSATPDATLSCPEEWSRRGAALLDGDGEWIGLNPGAFFGTAKRWIPERYAALASRLGRHTGARIAILGGTAERPLGEAIAASIDGDCRVLCGETDLAELVGALSRLRLLATNDSGPMHLAAAVGTPVVAVFGPTDWRETAPVGASCRLVREPVGCAPCKLRECPIDHRCMQRVTVDQVFEQAEALLGERGAASGEPGSDEKAKA
jgi:heptosyltransferase-2